MADAFRAASDFEYFERQALRRGVPLRRTDQSDRIGAGLSWVSTVKLRGRQRELNSVISAFDPHESYEIRTDAGGVVCFTTVELIALSRTRTRMVIGMDLRPDSLPGRLFVQSLKFAKSNLTRRFKSRARLFATDVEARASV